METRGKVLRPPENPLLPPGPDFSTSFHCAWKSRKRRGISTFPQRRRRLISAVKKSDPTRLRRRARGSCCQKWLPSSRQGGCDLANARRRRAVPSLPSLAHRGRAVETRETNSIKLEFVSPPPTKSSRAACTSTFDRAQRRIPADVTLRSRRRRRISAFCSIPNAGILRCALSKVRRKAVCSMRP